MIKVAGAAQHYAWGDRGAIPELLGRHADGRPWAEWWLGTHPVAPSHAGGRPLAEITGDLPFLLKLLAAAAPLSLQIHPSADIARDGFAREEADGVAIDSPQRLFRDPFAKPEILCAITPFEVLTGFRPLHEVVPLLRRLGGPVIDRLARELELGGPAAATALLLGDHGLEPDPIVAVCRDDDGATDPITAVVAALADAYPGDRALGAALLLNHRRLQPGQAVFLAAGSLHAYLSGLGVELMGPSDNVLRAGLTAKYVDVAAVLACLDPTELAEPLVEQTSLGVGVTEYITPTDWVLRRLDVDGELTVSAESATLALVTSGALTELGRGEAGLLVAGETATFTGHATVFTASQRQQP